MSVKVHFFLVMSKKSSTFARFFARGPVAQLDRATAF